MIPMNGVQMNEHIIEMIPKSKTYGLNLLEGKIDSQIDGLDAIKQAAFKLLETARYQHVIYNFSYGSELSDLIGRDSDYIEMELRRRIRDALTYDDRITDVTNFSFNHEDENVTVSFKVISIEGSFESEVMISV